MPATKNNFSHITNVELEGDLTDTLNNFKSLDGTVEGTLAQVLVEDITNLGTVDSINFGSGTVAVTIKTTFKYA